MNNNVYMSVSDQELRDDWVGNLAFRRRFEKPLMNWWLLMLMSILTLGIAAFAMFIIRIQRVDMYISRKRSYYAIIGEYMWRRAVAGKRTGVSERDLMDLRAFSENFANKVRPVGIFFTLLMTVLTCGLYMFWYIYRMNKVWFDAQNEEVRFNVLLSRIFKESELREQQIPFYCTPNLQRNFLLYMLLSFVTFGLWLIVWDYQTHVAPDNFFVSVHNTEDIVFITVRDSSC